MKQLFENWKKFLDEKSEGLWANIHAKRKRGESPAKPGDEDYPDKKQWDKLTKEQVAESTDAEQQIKQAQELQKSAEGELKAATSVQKANSSSEDPNLKKAAELEKQSKRASVAGAKAAVQDAKAAATAKPVSEQKSNYQKYVSRKGKGWKVRLLSKGKQATGSAYPDKAPLERSKSAPPGAGGS